MPCVQLVINGHHQTCQVTGATEYCADGQVSEEVSVPIQQRENVGERQGLNGLAALQEAYGHQHSMPVCAVSFPIRHFPVTPSFTANSLVRRIRHYGSVAASSRAGRGQGVLSLDFICVSCKRIPTLLIEYE